jgi:hypothetical protein
MQPAIMVVNFYSKHDYELGQSYRIKVLGVAGLYRFTAKLETGETGVPWQYEAIREAPHWVN